jgi:hypothetical protein
VTSGRNSVATAYASISDQVNSTGWAFLSVTTNPQFSDHDQAFAAGCLEGRLTWQDIYASWPSFLQANGYPGGNLQKQATAWMQSNFKWMEYAVICLPCIFLLLTKAYLWFNTGIRLLPIPLTLTGFRLDWS